MVNLGSWANRQDELRALAPTNPFAVVVLAQLACRATQPDTERLVSKLELAKLLKQWGYNESLRANLLRTIDSMLILPEALDRHLLLSFNGAVRGMVVAQTPGVEHDK